MRPALRGVRSRPERPAGAAAPHFSVNAGM